MAIQNHLHVYMVRFKKIEYCQIVSNCPSASSRNVVMSYVFDLTASGGLPKWLVFLLHLPIHHSKHMLGTGEFTAVHHKPY